jgi:peptide/nickel transport system substrate-binding protein
MKKMVIGMAVLMAAAALLAGCKAKSAVTTTDSGTAVDNSRRRMVAAIPVLPDKTDSMNTTSLYVRQGANYQTYDTLMRKTAGNETEMNMVESYSFSDDASECAFVLRKGIKWWDGTELTAGDIAFTIDRAKRSSGAQTTACLDIKTVEIQDDYNFKIIMANPNVALLEYLTYIFILNEDFVTKCGDTYGTSVETTMGSGPYKLTEWVYGDYLGYEAFEDYFRGPPAIKSVQLKIISDLNAAGIALQTGEIDLYLNDLPYISLPSIKQSPNLTTEEFYSSRYNYIVFNTESPLFNDVRMRQAVAHAIDRTEVLIIATEDVNNGTVVNGPGGPDFTGNPGVKTWPYEYNIEKARELVRACGNEGKEVTITTATVEPYIKIATKLQDYLTQIGLKAKINQIEMTAFINDVCDKGLYEISPTFNQFGGKDIDIAFSNLHSNKYGLSGNYARLKDPTLDKYIVGGKVITDLEKRKDHYREAIGYFATVLPMVPVYVGKGVRVFNSALAIEPNMSQYDRFYYYRWK